MVISISLLGSNKRDKGWYSAFSASVKVSLELTAPTGRIVSMARVLVTSMSDLIRVRVQELNTYRPLGWYIDRDLGLGRRKLGRFLSTSPLILVLKYVRS